MAPDPIFSVVSAILKLVFVWGSLRFLSDLTLQSLFSILKQVLGLINGLINNPTRECIIDVFPETLFKTRKIAGIHRDNFDKLVVCPTCDETYRYEDSSHSINGNNKLKIYF